MASFKGDIKSRALNMDIALNVILPYDHPHDYSKNPCKTLWLLHGQGSSASSWMRWTSIERYAMALLSSCRKYSAVSTAIWNSAWITSPSWQRSCPSSAGICSA